MSNHLGQCASHLCFRTWFNICNDRLGRSRTHNSFLDLWSPGKTLGSVDFASMEIATWPAKGRDDPVLCRSSPSSHCPGCLPPLTVPVVSLLSMSWICIVVERRSSHVLINLSVFAACPSLFLPCTILSGMLLVLENNEILAHLANKSDEELIELFIEVCRYLAITERILAQVTGKLTSELEG